jgi:hypothetical protein
MDLGLLKFMGLDLPKYLGLNLTKFMDLGQLNDLIKVVRIFMAINDKL